jgi:hypothetical protein
MNLFKIDIEQENVIPAKAGIQKILTEDAGCPPGAGMTV